MTKKIKISAVSYSNSVPFIFGLMQPGMLEEIDLSLDHPAACARKLLNSEVQIGLVPVAALPAFTDYHIISNYCLGADGAVKTVLLLSHVPLDEIETIYLDYQSRTSAALVQILSRNYWKRKVNFLQGYPHFEENVIQGNTAALVIGDRSLQIARNCQFSYDLSEEWKKFTGLPFVFATWTANTLLPATFLKKFNLALQWGLQNKAQSISMLATNEVPAFFDIQEYLEKNISYDLTDTKREGLNLFLEYLCQMQSCNGEKSNTGKHQKDTICRCKNKMNTKVNRYETFNKQ